MWKGLRSPEFLFLFPIPSSSTNQLNQTPGRSSLRKLAFPGRERVCRPRSGLSQGRESLGSHGPQARAGLPGLAQLLLILWAGGPQLTAEQSRAEMELLPVGGKVSSMTQSGKTLLGETIQKPAECALKKPPIGMSFCEVTHDLQVHHITRACFAPCIHLLTDIRLDLSH